MSDDNAEIRLLVKTKSGIPGARLQIDGARLRFAAQPLFKSIGATRERLAAAAPATWHVLKPVKQAGVASPSDVANPWDLCHQLLDGGLGITGGDQVEFAEPDLQQQWLVGRPGAVAVGLAMAPSEPDEQNPKYPTLADNFWYRDPKHAQWDGALAASADPVGGNRTRIAHLDTGYDPTHSTLPKYLNRKLQKNFVDDDRPDDASDDSGGLVNNLGHGTGTLSILAGAGIQGINSGKPFGCAPYAEIVPVRVANSVVLFRNSAIAMAFDYVHGLCANPATFVHVVTMSMGGVPSQSWVDAVNALYEAGVFVVTAAGNNYANLPTREIVYPARFARVVAACGVMADQTPYADLAPTLMAGNYGPPSKMTTALAGFTPNTPWARFGAPGIVDFDGNGTSAATPQIAAAAALWIQKNRAAYDKYPQAWMRVEAVRKALFESAHAAAKYADHFGRGKIAALDALGRAPARADELRDLKLPVDTASFPILSILTGLGMAAEASPRRTMLELEALQIVGSLRFETPIPDVAAAGGVVDARGAGRLAEELLSKPGLSKRLREALEGGAGAKTTAPVVRAPGSERPKAPGAEVEAQHLATAIAPVVPKPTSRRLQIYAYDPSVSTDLQNFSVNNATISICWEDDLKEGPVGEYLEVVDVDPASGCFYAPVDLNDPRLLAENGLPPSEANPQFHQQMCYAVAMRMIEYFERALGRKAMWSSRYVRDPEGNVISEEFVPRLRIYPHALRAANSFYSPERKALLFGHFPGKSRSGRKYLAGRARILCGFARYHRPRNHPCFARRPAPSLPGINQPGRSGLPRSFRGYRRPVPALQHAGSADCADTTNPRQHRAGQSPRSIGTPIWRGDIRRLSRAPRRPWHQPGPR